MYATSVTTASAVRAAVRPREPDEDPRAAGASARHDQSSTCAPRWSVRWLPACQTLTDRRALLRSGHPGPPPAASITLKSVRVGHGFVPNVCQFAGRAAAGRARGRRLIRRPPAAAARARGSRGRAGSPRGAPSASRAPTIRPCSSTTISSASAIVDSRWAMMIVVRSAHHLAQAGADPRLRRRVDRRGRVVEDQDPRVDQERARDRDPLALTARERDPALADRRCRTRAAAPR